MNIISYAQNFEDVMLWRALGHIEKGFYIDIGAQDPTIDSVSLAFHEHGWHGIHVEPTPHYAGLLRQKRPGDTVIQAAVGNGPAVMQFFEIPNTGISTADCKIADQHRERGFDVQEITVTSIPLSAIFETCPEEIHWLKIDVEGFEQQLLSSWGESLARPWIVVVESTLPLTQIETHDLWESLITERGYSPVYFDGLNRYYVSHAHSELKAAFVVPPNVFDGFTLNGTASAPFHKLIEERFQKIISDTVIEGEQQKALFEEETKRLHASHSLLTETYAEHQQSWLQTEKTLAQQNSLVKQELESLQHAHALREQEVTVQFVTLQQRAERDMAARTQDQNEQERALRQQLSVLQQDRLVREQVLHEKTSKVRQELESILRGQNHRERAIAEQLRAVEREKSELIRRYVEQERLLQHQHVERERGCAKQATQARLELENLLRQQIKREQQIAAQLVDFHQQAAREKAELLKIQAEQIHSISSELFEREKSLCHQLEVGKHELHYREQDWARREKEHAEQNIQSKQVLDRLLREKSQREQEINDQWLVLEQQTQEEKKQNSRLIEACATLEAELQAEIQSGQQASIELHRLLAQVQQDLDLTHASLSWRITAPLRRLAGLFRSTNDQAPGQRTSEQSLSIAPKIAPISAPSDIQETMASEQTLETVSEVSSMLGDVNFGVNDALTPEQNPLDLLETSHRTDLPASLEQTIPSSAYATATHMPINASTLSELLAFHDQQFVRCAYQTLLGRAPDPEGFSYYLNRIRSGFSKVQILAQLRLSPEGKAYEPKLPGLDEAIQKYQKSHTSLIKYLFRLFNAGEGELQIERKLRAIENQLGIFSGESNDRFNKIETSLSGLHNLISQNNRATTTNPAITSMEPTVVYEEISNQSLVPDGFNQLAPRAKDIYFQLKRSAFIDAGRTV
jgi:FkbM family methyltransferase